MSRDKVYTMIRKMRKELINENRLSDYYPEGKIPGWYFRKRCMISEEDCENEINKQIG